MAPVAVLEREASPAPKENATVAATKGEKSVSCPVTPNPTETQAQNSGSNPDAIGHTRSRSALEGVSQPEPELSATIVKLDNKGTETHWISDFFEPAFLDRMSIHSQSENGSLTHGSGQAKVRKRTYIDRRTSFSLSYSSSFDFSMEGTEILAPTIPKPAENAVAPEIDERTRLMMQSARKLQENALTRGILNSILHVSVLDNVIESRDTCVALRPRNGPRCKIKLKHFSDEVPDIFERVANLSVPDDWNTLFPQLKSIVDMSLCRHPHGRKAMEELLALDLRMAKWTESQDSTTTDASQGVISTLVQPWLRDICGDSHEKIRKLRKELAPGEVKVDPMGDSQISVQSAVTATPGATGPSDQRNADIPLQPIPQVPYIQSFRPYQPLNVKYLSTESAVRNVVKEPITGDDATRPKYLYIYWFPGNFGYIKIGVTENVPGRLRSWEEQCKHFIREHPQGPSGERVLVEHAHRVEKLVHTELKEFRFEETCCHGCGRRHKEWFRCEPEHAARIIKKYSDWTNTKPYILDKRRAAWVLSDKIKENEIREICKPVPQDTQKQGWVVTRKSFPVRMRRKSPAQLTSLERLVFPTVDNEDKRPAATVPEITGALLLPPTHRMTTGDGTTAGVHGRMGDKTHRSPIADGISIISLPSAGLVPNL